jgi:hypothetical protein
MRHRLRSGQIWKSMAAGACGSVAHALLMYLKSRMEWLPSFQPYQSLQTAIGDLVGGVIDPRLPWLLSFINGSTIVGLLFGQIYSYLPGGSGISKGLVFGVICWAVMGSVFFPLIGLGFFATGIGLGLWPPIFSLAMLLTYSSVLGWAYDLLQI